MPVLNMRTCDIARAHRSLPIGLHGPQVSVVSGKIIVVFVVPVVVVVVVVIVLRVLV